VQRRHEAARRVSDGDADLSGARRQQAARVRRLRAGHGGGDARGALRRGARAQVAAAARRQRRRQQRSSEQQQQRGARRGAARRARRGALVGVSHFDNAFSNTRLCARAALLLSRRCSAARPAGAPALPQRGSSGAGGGAPRAACGVRTNTRRRSLAQ
jgi:hypothetical protein